MPTRQDLPSKRYVFLKALTEPSSLSERDFRITFLDVRQHTLAGRQFFYGYLAKYRPETAEEVADLESRTVAVEIAQDRISSKSRFFVELRSGLIAYHPATPDMRKEAFELKFKKLFENAFENFFIDVQIDPIQERFSIIEELDRFDAIAEVDITLRPSNPNNSDIWGEIDEEMKSRNVKFTYEKLVGDLNSGGLRIKTDKDLRSRFQMAEDGYGRASIRGTRDGHTKFVSSRTEQIRFKGPDDEEEMSDTFEWLEGVVTSLLERFDDHKDR